MSDNVDAEFEKACAAMSQEQSPASVAAQAEKGPNEPFTPEEFKKICDEQPQLIQPERIISRFIATVKAQGKAVADLGRQNAEMLAGNRQFCLALAILCMRQGGGVQVQKRELESATINKYGDNLQMRRDHETGSVDFRVKLPGQIVVPAVMPNIVQGVFPCPKK